MVRTFRFLIVAVLLGMFSLSLVGCSDEGPAEKVGKKVDQAVDKIKDDAKKVFE
ncbi:MAG: transport-associated protein [Desulfovibrio sp.]|uniref:transport-associated protein n=1 Tax=Desulfovibrio sp. 7SRBS1 TaxID=3378064 RepID=UPI003B41790E